MNPLVTYLLLSIILTIYSLKIFRAKTASRKLFISCVLFILGVLLIDIVWDSIRLWGSYQDSDVQQYWLPPHSNIVYGHIARLAQPLMVGLIVAAAVFTALTGLKKIFKLEQYGTDEIYLLTISALVSNWPGVLISLVAIFIIAVFASIIRRLASKEKEDVFRLIITPYILPVTIIMLWVIPYLNNVTGLSKIKFY